MDDMLKSLCGVDGIPFGVPPPLALTIAMNGYTENEARQMMIEGGDISKADEWIECLRRAGYFAATNESDDFNANTTEENEDDLWNDTSAGSYLWKMFLKKLRNDELGFKHQLMVLDNCVKNPGGRCDLNELHNQRAGTIIPFESIRDHCPWNGCKFAASVVMHMISPTSSFAKCNAVRPANRSLGGCSLPMNLSKIRWPYELSDAYQRAIEKVEMEATSLFVSVTDVEIMKNPGKFVGGWPQERATTFSHTFVMTVCKDGVHLFQAYGPLGYTLLQKMEDNDARFPLSLEDGKKWVDRFEIFAANLCGEWTKEVNDAYLECFDVNLFELGYMKIGSQMDVYVNVLEIPFDKQTVKANFDLLPKPDFPQYPPCDDGKAAKAKKAPPRYAPDGGVKRRYVPLVLRCARCGKSADTEQKHKRCTKCKKVYYCGRECQVADWRQRHKIVCKNLSLAPELGPP